MAVKKDVQLDVVVNSTLDMIIAIETDYDDDAEVTKKIRCENTLLLQYRP